jgi:hypothetical protein
MEINGNKWELIVSLTTLLTISLMFVSLGPAHTERVAMYKLTTQTPCTNGQSHSHAVIEPGPNDII